MKLHLLGLLFFCAFTGIAGADPGQILMGGGGTSCDDWSKSRAGTHPEVAHQVEQWIYGYVSGVNYFAPEGKQRFPRSGDAALAFVDRFCDENPLRPIVDAANELMKRAPTVPPK